MKDLRTRESAEEIRREKVGGKGWRPPQPEEFGAVKVGAVLAAVKDNGLLAKQYATRRGRGWRDGCALVILV